MVREEFMKKMEETELHRKGKPGFGQSEMQKKF